MKLGRTVDELEETLYYDEWLQWQQYYVLNPPGWEDDYRAGVIVHSFMGSMGGKAPPMTDMFPSLNAVFKQNDIINKNNRAMPQGRILQMMNKAKGGDGSGWKMSKLEEKRVF